MPSQNARGADNLIACHSAPADKRYWAWREIDGRRCWFHGARTTPKALLFWGPDEDDRRARDAADRGSDRLLNADRDNAPVSVIVPPWSPAPMRILGPWEKAWRDLELDMKVGPFTDPTPMGWKAR
jgi:hypothetical protein